ncbi:type II toxin-antitoxin system prevent-host-death family antitoxin [Cohnella caldifontis]|uniref:type II toxin-antitoxin system prevent-host-death family antitoxin n=1 Tax=Cohnella caldifontis TaxID=3027471 RepID=UPI0023EADDAB|nr:type II toxin-antitoxin system prevent-host-death family antitoxin [Cohnella sp. YIM B05605]
MRVSSTEVQNNFGKYLKFAEAGEEIIVTRNGKDIAAVTAIVADTVKEHQASYSTSGERVTYEEFLELTESSEQRYELIDGVVYNLAAPSYKHQKAVQEILGTFYNWFKGKDCVPLTSPFDITLPKSSDNICVVQPDVFVICDKTNLDDKGKYLGTPTLVVEVLSPSTRSKDMLKKLELYKECGVREYWIVDPMKDQVLVYRLDDKEISDYKAFSKSADMDVRSCFFEGLSVNLNDMFE